MRWETELTTIMLSSDRAEIVRAVGTLDLNDCWAAAGIVRNTVWDNLHHYARPTPLNDIDIAYFDTIDLSRETEDEIAAQLQRSFKDYNFSVKNQARMHIRNKHAPYISSGDAIKRWTETCTAVGVAWKSSLKILAPYGLEDLFNLRIRPTSHDPTTLALVRRRVNDKHWLTIWPQLTLDLE